MHRKLALLLITLLFAVASLEGQEHKATPEASIKPAPLSPVTVPEGNGAPVITDGIQSPGEWDDALPLAISNTLELRFKQYRGVVFIFVHGLKGLGPVNIGPSDLFLATPGGSIHQLHVSAQLGEIILPPTGEAPPFRFGLTTDWYANEQRRDMDEAARLQKAGKNPFEIISATSYPSDGIEFAIRRTKIPGQTWLLRLGASAFVGDKPGFVIFPIATQERTTDGWLELRFK